MTDRKLDPEAGHPAKGAGPKPGAKRPEWAQGLRKLYDSVVEEPLPDSFEELLRKLGDN